MGDVSSQGESGGRGVSHDGQKQDSAWKDIIEELFEDFLAFFFPRIHGGIDFKKGYTFLDKELQKILKQSETGKRYADKLVKVYLTSGGEEKWLLVHVEVQGYKEKDLAERIYIYNYRIFDRYRKEVISAVILTDTDPAYRPERYIRSRWGFTHTMTFPVVKLIDYRLAREKLEVSTNPFALVVEAFLRYIDGKGNQDRLYAAKRQCIAVLFEKNYNKYRIRALLRFIDWVLQLPEVLERRLEEELPEITGGKSMPYVTSWERMAAERAAKKAKKDGIIEGKIKDAKRMLSKGMDIALISEITELPEEKIIQLQEEGESSDR